ncbi:unnamed protein product [Amoebophrya sp. A25]|nr:unnamed protein product [Amoebophrya sp. A25]|eukprot:GSA25T00005453001.1
MKDVVEALRRLEDQSDRFFCVQNYSSGEYVLWFVGPRKLYHWLWEEVEEGFYVLSKVPPGGLSVDGCCRSLHISRTLCTELPTVVSCSEQGEAEAHQWDQNLASLVPVDDVLAARKFLSAITELGQRLEYPVFVAIPGQDRATTGTEMEGGEKTHHGPLTTANGSNLAFLGMRTLLPGEENLRTEVFQQGLHILETFDVSAPVELLDNECNLPALMGPAETDEVELRVRFELVSLRPSPVARWCRGPFCSLEVTYTARPQAIDTLFPLRYPPAESSNGAEWAAMVYLRGDCDDDTSWPQIRLLKYLLSRQNLYDEEVESGSPPPSKRLRIGSKDFGFRQHYREKYKFASGSAASSGPPLSGRCSNKAGVALSSKLQEGSGPQAQDSSKICMGNYVVREPLLPLEMESFLAAAPYQEEDFVDLLWDFLASKLIFATATSADEVKSSMSRVQQRTRRNSQLAQKRSSTGGEPGVAPSRGGPGGTAGSLADSLLGAGAPASTNDSFLFPAEPESPPLFGAANFWRMEDSPPARERQEQEDAWHRLNLLDDAERCGAIVSTLRLALRGVFQHLASAGMPYIRKNNHSSLAEMISQYLICFTRERRYGNSGNEDDANYISEDERRERKRRFFEELQFLERASPESDLTILRLFADCGLEAGREECRRYRRSLGFETPDDNMSNGGAALQHPETSGTTARAVECQQGVHLLTPDMQYLNLRSQFHVTSLAEMATRAGLPWEAVSRLVRKASTYYDGSLDRCRSLPVFSLPLGRVVGTKLFAKCVPFVRPCFVRAAGRNRVLRFERTFEHRSDDVAMSADSHSGDQRERSCSYSVVRIDIRKFADESTSEHDGGTGLGVALKLE